MWLRFSLFFLSGLLFFSSHLWAYDYSIELDFPNFKAENFLDIKSYEFRPEWNDAWYSSTNGLRVSSGSLDLDVFYIQSAIRIQQSLHPMWDAKYRLDHEAYYTIQPYRQQFELQLRPLESIGISGIGFPAYDKRRGEFGLALEWGKQPWNYIRFAHLEQAPYYNEKNFETDRFVKEAIEDRLEGAYDWGNRWKFRFNLYKDHPLERYFPSTFLTYRHEGHDNKLRLEYHYGSKARVGSYHRGFQIEKSRLTSNESDMPEDRSQILRQVTSDFYWIRPVVNKHSLTLGTRYDRFQNRFRDRLAHENSINYAFDTWQVYGSWVQAWNLWLDMDYSVFIGKALESKTYLANEVHPDDHDEDVEGKLRVAWDIHSLPKKGNLQITTTWNLDNLFGDFWDGGHMAYQTLF